MDIQTLNRWTRDNLATVIPLIKEKHYKQCDAMLYKDAGGSLFPRPAEVVEKKLVSMQATCVNGMEHRYKGSKVAVFLATYSYRLRSGEIDLDRASCVFALQKGKIVVSRGITKAHINNQCLKIPAKLKKSDRLYKIIQNSYSVQGIHKRQRKYPR